jgi:hypothetical protein
VPAGEVWGDLTPAEQARAFEGQHAAPLQWFEESVHSPTQTPVVLDDSIAIQVTYEGAKGRTNTCQPGLYVPVRLEIRTAASGLIESGVTDVFITRGAPLRATFRLEGAHATIAGELIELTSGMPPSGSIVATGGGAPGGWASFPAESPGAGGAGGSG